MIPRLCRVPAGEFIMGREPEQPVTQEAPPRTVYLDEFYIDETPVTCAQYQVFVEWMLATNDHSKCHPDEPSGKDHRPFISNEDLDFHQDQPITGIDWFDMWAFAGWAGMRLPTEAEWEKAARGTDGRRWPWGNESGLRHGKLQALYDDDHFFVNHPRLAGVYDHPLGASPFGCLDMAGNVWEVCQDSYDKTWYQRMPKRNPKKVEPADAAMRQGKCRRLAKRSYKRILRHSPRNTDVPEMVVMRGGCWRFNEHDAMCSIRAGLNRYARTATPIVGFRCASDIPNPCGAIGPMRHLKPEGERTPPDSSWTTIVHPDGMEYYDGDVGQGDVGQGALARNSVANLCLGNGEDASLNDFLILYWSAPPRAWMQQFTDVDTRSHLREAHSVQWITADEEVARSFEATATSQDSDYLEGALRRFVQPLQEAACISDSILIRPEPLRSLNGFAYITEPGAAVLGVHAGILRIHERLGRALGLRWLGREQAYSSELAQMLAALRDYVRSGGSSSSLPHIADAISDFSSAAYGALLSRLMTIMVLSHELGHIKLGHRSDTASLTPGGRHQQEFDADRLGLELALGADEVQEWIDGFATALGFWCAFIESCEGDSEGSDTHPAMRLRASCMRQQLPPELVDNFDYGMRLMETVS